MHSNHTPCFAVIACAGGQRISDMLSSHPVTSERIKRFEQNEGETP